MLEFKKWWVQAFQSGVAKQGQARLSGVPTIDNLLSGEAQLFAQAEFSEVNLDYGYQRDWPRITDSSGTIRLINDEVEIEPKDAFLEGDRIHQAEVALKELFSPSRYLQLSGNTQSSFANVVAFLCSDDASWLCGQTLTVDGGLSLTSPFDIRHLFASGT